MVGRGEFSQLPLHHLYVYSKMPGVGKGKDADLGLCQDRSGINKRGEAERDRGPRWGWTSK